MLKEYEKRIISSLILIPLSFFFIIKGSIIFNIFLIIFFVVASYEWHTMSKRKNYHFIGYLFLIFSFYSAFNLRNNLNAESLVIFLFIIIICISTDIGGYLFGKILKGPKLTKLSPNKTYAGMLGGYVFSFVIIYFFIEYSEFLFNQIVKWTPEVFIYIILISSVSQIGDITISYYKRLSRIKDTGKIIPGHGGILDRIDGMIFAFPFSYVVLNFYTLIY